MKPVIITMKIAATSIAIIMAEMPPKPDIIATTITTAMEKMAQTSTTAATIMGMQPEMNMSTAITTTATTMSFMAIIATITVTMAGTEAANDTVRLIKLPKRAMVDPTHSSVVSEGVATTATIDIGDDDTAGVGAAADADRYADGLDVAAAGVDSFDSIAAAARLTPYVLGAESWIILTWATMNTPVAAKKLTVRLGYIVVS